MSFPSVSHVSRGYPGCRQSFPQPGRCLFHVSGRDFAGTARHTKVRGPGFEAIGTSNLGSRLTRPAPPVCDESSRIMCAVSFTFKYLPNIIQKFCTHVAVRGTCALTAWVPHVSNLLYRHYRTRPGCVVCDWARGAGSQPTLGLPMMPVLSPSSPYGTQIR